MEERLKHILSLVIEFVKFAEAKNAALLAVDSALIIGSLQAWLAMEHSPVWTGYYLASALLFLGLSVIVVLLSFLPLKTFPVLRASGALLPSDNLVFFGDIAKYDASQFLAALNESPAPDPSQNPRYEADLAGQVIINSRVALRKYRCFTWALWLTIYGVTTPIVAFCAWIILFGIKKRFPNG